MSRSRRAPVATHNRPRSYRVTRRLRHGADRARVRDALVLLDGERATAPTPRHDCKWDMDLIDCRFVGRSEWATKLSRK